MEPSHRCSTSRICTVIDKCAIALRYEEDAFNVLVSVSGEMILQIADHSTRWKISYPKSMARLFRLSRRSTRRRGDHPGANIRMASASRCKSTLSAFTNHDQRTSTTHRIHCQIYWALQPSRSRKGVESLIFASVSNPALAS